MIMDLVTQLAAGLWNTLSLQSVSPAIMLSEITGGKYWETLNVANISNAFFLYFKIFWIFNHLKKRVAIWYLVIFKFNFLYFSYGTND